MTMIAMLFSCGGGGGGEEPPKEQKNPPAKAVGVLPANGESCSDYEEIIGNENRVLIAFKWNAAQFAQSYEVVAFYGGSEIARKSVGGLETKIELDKRKTYTWQIVSINGDGEATSNTYSFTSPGVPVGNYAPYAAEITIEFNVATSEMSISWIGSDEDGDELTYDVTVWENGSILMEEIDYTVQSMGPITFINGENYTVEIVSKDSSGNSSISKASAVAPL
ncbi:MAG: hypothetical protein R2819_10665 [Allomuricauda sp.]